MLIHRGFRYRLYATPDQEALFRQFAGACRFVYNLALEQREREWTYFRDAGEPLTLAEQSRQLTALRAEVDWLAAVPRVCMEHALRDLRTAFDAFFSGRGSFPRYRHKGRGDSIFFQSRNCQVRSVNQRWSEVRLPNIGWIRFRDTRPMRGDLVNVTVSLDALGWHVVFTRKIECEPLAGDLPAVGIDRGVANTLALSTGEMLSLPARLGELDRKHQLAQRRVARRKRGSNRYRKALRRAALIAAKRYRIRKDWQHKTSRNLVTRFSAVVFEDLNVSGMTARGRGKRGLNRSIMNQGWSGLVRAVSYKLEERGGHVVLVDAAYTSQTCSSCGVIDGQSRESQAVFACRHCGHVAHADTNAAINILRRSTASMGVEGSRWRPDEALTVTAIAA